MEVAVGIWHMQPSTRVPTHTFELLQVVPQQSDFVQELHVFSVHPKNPAGGASLRLVRANRRFAPRLAAYFANQGLR